VIKLRKRYEKDENLGKSDVVHMWVSEVEFIWLRTYLFKMIASPNESTVLYGVYSFYQRDI